MPASTQVVKHITKHYGYGSERDGHGECTCGWSVEDDLWGTDVMAHEHVENIAYVEALEAVARAARRVLDWMAWDRYVQLEKVDGGFALSEALRILPQK
jgi:hypothetical protein